MAPTTNNQPNSGGLMPPIPSQNEQLPGSAPQGPSAFGGGQSAVQTVMAELFDRFRLLAQMIPSAVPFIAETLAKLSTLSPTAAGAGAGMDGSMQGPPPGAPGMGMSAQLPPPPGS